jgi:tetratricopeptide (TPR) repeat protein
LELSKAYPDFYHESPHNVLLDVLCSQGLPALAAFAAIAAIGFSRASRNAALAAGLLAVLTSLQFTAFTAVTALAYFALVALLVSEDSLPSAGRLRGVWVSLPVLAAAVLSMAAVRLVVADRHLDSVRSGFNEGSPEQARAAYEKCLRWALPGGSPDLYYSRRAAAAGRLSEALIAGERATKTSEDPQNAWYGLAAIQAALEDAGGVERSLRSAIRLSPNWYKPRWTLAQLLAKLGRTDEARREAAISADLAGAKHPEVVETLTLIQAMGAKAQPSQ